MLYIWKIKNSQWPTQGMSPITIFLVMQKIVSAIAFFWVIICWLVFSFCRDYYYDADDDVINNQFSFYRRKKPSPSCLPNVVFGRRACQVNDNRSKKVNVHFYVLIWFEMLRTARLLVNVCVWKIQIKFVIRYFFMCKYVQIVKIFSSPAGSVPKELQIETRAAKRTFSTCSGRSPTRIR